MNRRILRVAVWALVLCLCGSFAAAEDFTQEEWYKMGTEQLKKMTAESAWDAAENFSAAGNYEFAQNYRQYALSIREILLANRQGADLDTAILRLQMISSDEAFGASLAENRYPSCDQLLTYIRAVLLERDGNYFEARETYGSIFGVLDSMDKQVDLVPKAYEQADSLYQQGEFKAAAKIFQELSKIGWKDSQEKYQRILSNHEHQWTEATCTEPRTCQVFGETEGAPLGHNWREATCTEPRTCMRCGAVEGTALGHDWKDATCTEPKTCRRCGITEGKALGHDWRGATCTEPKTCRRCRAVEGPALGHDWAEATYFAPKTCRRCGATEGDPIPMPVMTAPPQRTGKVGISFPTGDLWRWVRDGEYIQKQLEAKGYDVVLSYAGNNVAIQISNLEDMISNGCEALIVAPVDGSALNEVLDKAKEAHIMVLAYDRLLYNTDAVNYYVTFNNYIVGTVQGYYIVDKLGLKNTDRVYRMEVFAGDPSDNNARLFYSGAMDVLRPYIEYGTLVIPSGEMDFESCAISLWRTDEAQARMDRLLTKAYADGSFPDVVLSPNDSIALGITNSLEAARCPAGNFPVITGQDCDRMNIRNIIAGKQSMSIFKDTQYLGSSIVEMVNAWYAGEEVPVNDTVTYDNGTIIVPTLMCYPVYVDATNYRELLIDPGYYTEADLQ